MLRKPLILIADDDAGCRKALCMILENDFSLLYAKDGVEAVEKAKTESPDLILMDIRMPRLNGWDAIREIRNGNHSKPIIVITAYPDPAWEKQAEELNVKTCLAKPFDIIQLRDLIEKELARRKNPEGAEP